MSVLVWDAVGERRYETGTKNGVLYPMSNNAYPQGYAWNGLTAVTVSPEGAEATDLYADDIKYLTMRSAENVKATIEAYTYPDEWAQCDGSATAEQGVTIGQQPRTVFGFSWVTTVGNDTQMDNYGYKIHILYGCSASPSEKAYQTINDSPEAITFSWEISTIPAPVGDGFKPTAYIVIDSTKADATKLAALKKKLYGGSGEGENPYLPLPAEVLSTMHVGA